MYWLVHIGLCHNVLELKIVARAGVICAAHQPSLHRHLRHHQQCDRSYCTGAGAHVWRIVVSGLERRRY